MHTDPAHRFVLAAFLLVIVGIGAFFEAPAHAETRLSGKYERVEMSGHTAPCQSPVLLLHSDGTYEIWAHLWWRNE